MGTPETTEPSSAAKGHSDCACFGEWATCSRAPPHPMLVAVTSFRWLHAAWFATCLVSACEHQDLDAPVGHGDGDDLTDPDAAQIPDAAALPEDRGERDAGAHDTRPVEAKPEPYFVGRFDHAHFTGA